MPRKSSVDGVSSLLHFVQRVFGGRPRPERARRSAARRRLLFESLETRSLMATDLGEITGRVFLDIDILHSGELDVAERTPKDRDPETCSH